MSKIEKYKETIYNFLINKSCFASILDNNLIKEIIDSDMCYYPIILLSVFSTQVKKNKVKSYHTLHLASVIIIMSLIVIINENEEYYQTKYGEKNIKKILNQSTIYIYESVSQNIKTMDVVLDEDVSAKIQKKILSFLHDKLLVLSETFINDKKLKMKKTDIITYHFEDRGILNDKYRKLSRIEKDDILKYINDKYCIIGQCAILFGWIMGLGDLSAKTIENITKLGTSLGYLIKITYDFCHLEDNIKNSKNTSYNYVVNYGIHEGFALFDQHKVKFVEGCMLNNIYNPTIKELIETLEDHFDECLKKTDLDLKSQYSSFISEK